jgi:hypothetical protein
VLTLLQELQQQAVAAHTSPAVLALPTMELACCYLPFAASFHSYVGMGVATSGGDRLCALQINLNCSK